MKQCPQCKSLYADDTLDFCTEDGTRLIVANQSEDPTLILPAGENDETTRLRPRRVTPLPPTVPMGNVTAGQNAGDTNRTNRAPNDYPPPPNNQTAQPIYPPAAVKQPKSNRLAFAVLGAFAALFLVAVAGILWYGASRGWLIGSNEENINRRVRNVNQAPTPLPRNANRPDAPVVTNGNSNLAGNDNRSEMNDNAAAPEETETAIEEAESYADASDRLKSFLNLENRRLTALTKADRETLDDLLAENFVSTSEDGVQTKKQYLNSLEAETHLESWQYVKPKLYLNGQQAILTGNLKLKYDDGTPTETLTFTETFVREAESWKLLSSSVTEVE